MNQIEKELEKEIKISMPENKSDLKTLENISEAKTEFQKKIQNLMGLAPVGDEELQPIYQWMITEFIPLAKNLVYWKEAQKDFEEIFRYRSVSL